MKQRAAKTRLRSTGKIFTAATLLQRLNKAEQLLDVLIEKRPVLETVWIESAKIVNADRVR